ITLPPANLRNIGTFTYWTPARGRSDPIAFPGAASVRAIRFHYRPARYLWTRFAASHRPALALGPTGCVSLDRVQPPELPGPDWVRIETTLSGICGSDLSAVTASDSFTLEPFGAYPFTFGHENVGRVVQA